MLKLFFFDNKDNVVDDGGDDEKDSDEKYWYLWPQYDTDGWCVGKHDVDDKRDDDGGDYEVVYDGDEEM